MPYKYNVKIDFYEDWVKRLKGELEGLGYHVKETGYNICINYFNLKKRLIEPIKRKVLISKEFKCPKNLENGLNLLKKKIETGEDIRLHLSKYILDLDYNDDLLNDWGIYHLHLGTEVDKKTNFIKRTGPLLFARFDEEYAYFINIYQHGAWTKQEMIKILHENWPESINQFRVNGIESISPKPTDEEYKKLRQHHLVTFVEIEKGVIYFPLGRGYMSSGHSTEVIELCDYYFKLFKNYEDYIKSNIVQIVNMLKKAGAKIENKLHFYLWLEDNKVFAYELFSNSKIELGPLL